MKLSSSILSAVFTTLLPFYVKAESDASTLDADLSCVGTFIFGRHNDRVFKPANYLTTYGATRQVASGNFYRERYFGLDANSEPVDSDFIIDGLNDQGYVVYGETYAQAPASSVIEYSQIAFLQGLYPPSNAVNEAQALESLQDPELSNGTDVVAPFDGYQYAFMDIQQETSNDYIWIKGDDNCPAYDAAVDAWYKTDAFISKNESTWSFYQSLSDILPSKSWPKWKLNYGMAFSIFDFMNVNWIHDEELASKWNSSVVQEVTILADQSQWGISYDTNDKLSNLTIGGRTFLGGVLNYLNTTKVEGSPYINYFTGSYDTMLQLFGLMDLYLLSDNFTGIPDYGATLVWDLLQSNSTGDYYVQFSFKNGTDDSDMLVTYPTFNTSKSMLSWSEFVENMESVAITTLSHWCSACSTTENQCAALSDAYVLGSKLEDQGISLSQLVDGASTSLDMDSDDGLSNAAAGGIGAGVTIGVFLILGGMAYLFYKYKKSEVADIEAAVAAKDSAGSDNSFELDSGKSTVG